MLKIQNTRAAILTKSSEPLVVDEIELPRELFSGQVLVEVFTSGICGAQINEIDAVKGPDKFLPHLLGHEGFCKILQVGPNVTTLAEGDMAIMHWRPGSGLQAEPAKYLWKGKVLNSGWVTTFNQHCVISENRLTKVNVNLSQKFILPLLGCALTTALGVLQREAKVKSDDSLLVFGAGGVGLTLIKIAKFLGLKNILAVDIDSKKLEVAAKFGASDTFVCRNKTEMAELFSKQLGALPPTLAIDTTGNTDAIELCYEFSDPQARVILVGVPKIGNKTSIYTLPLHFGKVLTGSKGGNSEPEIDIPYLLNLLHEKKLDFSDFPTHVYPLTQINEAIGKLKAGQVGRMIIDFSLVG
jgi:Zn-dependent alcohol dehydrogenase